MDRRRYDQRNRQRRSADLEEIVRGADALLIEDLRKIRAYPFLHLSFRRHILPFLRRVGDVRQLFLVNLAVHGKRHLIELKHGVGHHIRRQTALEEGTELRYGDLIFRGIIPRQIVFLSVVAHDHLAQLHARVLEHDIFDLIQLDAQAAQLHLVVHAPEVIVLAVLVQPHKVSAVVRLLSEAREERSSRSVRELHVASSHARAADDQLAAHSGRHDPLLLVHHVVRHVSLRLADGDRLSRKDLRGRAAHGRLRGAVSVHHVRVRVQLLEPRDQRGRKSLTADVVRLQRRYGLAHFRHLKKAGKVRRRTYDGLRMVLRHQLRQLHGIMYLVKRRHAQCHAVAERHEALRDGHVEGDRGHGQRRADILRVPVNRRVHGICVQVVAHVPVLDHHALGISGGT